MTYQISEKTQDILDAVIEWGGKTSEYPYLVKSQILTIPKYNFSTSKKSNLFEFICTKQEYDDFVSGLIHYAGKNYYEQYLNSTRTPLEPKIKDAEFEHGEVLDYKNYGVIYLCHSVATVKKSYVIINNNPVCVPTRYLSKIETAEQKAAKERMQVINAMVAIIGCSSPPFSGSRSQAVECSATLYDAGYRK